MCEVVDYTYNGERMFTTAGAQHSRLPVRQRRSEVVVMTPWGAQGRQFCDMPRISRVQWPDAPCVPLSTIKGGAWADFQPDPVRIPVIRFMVFRLLDIATLDHWVTLRPGEYIQGALLRRGTERAVYVVTVDPPARLSVVSPWPRVVGSRQAATAQGRRLPMRPNDH